MGYLKLFSIFNIINQIIKTVFVVFITLICIDHAIASNEQLPKQLKILTLNTWLLRIRKVNLAEDIDQRRALIAMELEQSNYDIVMLQEVWSDADMRYLATRLLESGKFKNCTSHDAGRSIGNGLMIFSKFPLLGKAHQEKKNWHGCHEPEAFMEFSEITRSDEKYVNKGAMHVRLQITNQKSIDVYTTHTGAVSYDLQTQKYDQHHLTIGANQVREIKSFIEKTSKTNNVLFGGDLNQNPEVRNKTNSMQNKIELTEQYRLITEEMGFTDVFASVNQLSPDQLRQVSTFDPIGNAYVISGRFAEYPGELLDYVFLKQTDQFLAPIQSRLVFTQPSMLRNGKPMFISDHYGIEATFLLNHNR